MAEANVATRYQNRDLLNQGARAPDQFPIDEQTVTEWIDLNGVLVVELFAYCEVLAVAPTAPSSQCLTTADPVWSFDQAAFDAQWGPASFPLDEYVGFAYAESAVPEPGGATGLLVVGAIVLVGVRVRAWLQP